MRRLLYFICSNLKFWPVLEYNLSLTRQFNPSLDILCIVPKGLKHPPIEGRFGKFMIWATDSFDGQGMEARYKIGDWEGAKDYDSFLYLDADAFVCGNLSPLFDVIEANDKKVHGVPDIPDINDNSNYSHYKFTDRNFKKGTYGFNSGTFGFSSGSLGLIQEVRDSFAKTKLVGRKFSDQTYFNEVLAEEKCVPSLAPFIKIYSKGGYNIARKRHALVFHATGRLTPTPDKKIGLMTSYLLRPDVKKIIDWRLKNLPPPVPPSITLCTCLFKFGHYFKKVFPDNFAKVLKSYPNINFSICIFGGNDGTEQWLKENYEKYIGNRIALIVQNNEFFRMSEAKNIAHFGATGDFVMNCDGDNILTDEYLKDLTKAVLEVKNDKVAIRPKNLIRGRLGLWKKDFVSLNGYDATKTTYWPDDRELYNRAVSSGCKTVMLNSKFGKERLDNSKEQHDNYEPPYDTTSFEWVIKKDAVYAPLGTGLGDLIASIAFCVHIYDVFGATLKVSDFYINGGGKKRDYSNKLREILSLYPQNVQNKLKVVNESPTEFLNWRFAYGHPYPQMNGFARTQEVSQPYICYQFDGKSHPSRTNFTPDGEALILKAIKECGHEAVKLGGDLSLKECLGLLNWASLFVGIDSGMSHLALSAACPSVIAYNNKTQDQVAHSFGNKEFVMASNGADAARTIKEILTNSQSFDSLARRHKDPIKNEIKIL